MKTREIPRTIHYSLLTIHKPLRGFTLVEILIVVAILGILAAVIIPEYRGYTQKAKESAAKDNLRILREAIERYAVQHNGVGPGYPDDDPTAHHPSRVILYQQLVDPGNYLPHLPKNPFNNSDAIYTIGNNQEMPDVPLAISSCAWLYKPSTKDIRLNWPGTDSTGVRYYDY